VFVFAALLAAAVAHGAESGLDKRLFESALDLYRLGKVEQALADFQKLREEFSSSEYADDALFELARHAYDVERLGEFRPTRDPEEAKKFLEAILAEYPASDKAPEALVRMGMLHLDPYVAPPNLNEAYANFLRVQNIYPASDAADAARFGLGYTLYHQGEFERAAGTLERLLTDFSDRAYLPTARLYAARALAAHDRPQEALHHLARLHREFPDGPYAEQALDGASLLARFAFPHTYTFRGSVALGEDRESFRRVSSLRMARDGSLLAVDTSLRQAARFDRNGKRVASYAAEKPGDVWEAADGTLCIANERDVLVGEKAIAVEEDTPRVVILYDRLKAVVTTLSGEIVAFDEKQDTLIHADRDGLVQNHLIEKIRDAALLCDAQDRIWVLSSGERSLRCLTLGGDTLVSLEAGRDSPVEQPSAFALDAMGNVYVLDARKLAVLVFDPSLKLLKREILPPDDSDGELSQPTALAVTRDGAVLVFDEGHGKMLRYE
jgi:TolA-binding protein